MHQNRKTLLDSIDPQVSAFLQEGNPKAKQDKQAKQEKPKELQETNQGQHHEVAFNNTTIALKPVTFMLSSDLVDEIMLLSAQRKISKQKPYSQKDILTEALRDWISKNK